MKKLVYILSLALFSLFFASCEEDTGAYYPVPTDFSVSPTNATENSAGGTVEITIEGGNLGWWIETQDNWCKVSKQYGSGDGTVILTIDSNNTGSPRSSIVKVNPTFEKEPVTITISQD